MSYAELIEDGTLNGISAAWKRHNRGPVVPFIYPDTDDTEAAIWPNPIDRLDQKGRRANPGQSTHQHNRDANDSSHDQAPANSGNNTAILINLAVNVLPVVCAALVVAALLVLGEASRHQVWEIAIPAGLAAVGCGLLLLGVLRFRRHFQSREKQRNC